MFSMGRVGAALSALALAGLVASAMEVKMERVKMGGGYFPFSVQVKAAPDEQLVKQPTYVGTPMYASFNVGNGSDTVITIALDDDAKPPRIYVDCNNDQDLTNDGDGSWATFGSQSPETTPRYNNSKPLVIQAGYNEGGKEFTLSYWVTAYRFYGTQRSERDKQNVFLYSMTKLKGTLAAGGKSVMVMLGEEHPGGDFSKLMEQPLSRGVSALMVDYNGDGKIASDSRLPEMVGKTPKIKLDEPFYCEGKSYAIKSVSPSGQSMTVEETDVKTEPPVFPEIPDVSVGKMAPLFSGPALDGGKDISLKDLRGKVVLLDFWATWCIWCEREIPNVTPVWNEYKGKDFVIVGVCLDDATRVSREKITEYAAKHEMAWRHLFRGDAFGTPEAKNYDIQGIPAMFLLDRTGKIVKRDMEIRGPGKLEAAVKEALAGKAEPAKKEEKPKSSAAAAPPK